jgi:hypothetical protein
MKLGRGVLISAAGAAIIAGAGVLFFDNGPTGEYRACVALMWDRKHPEAVKQRKREADLRECEAYRLRTGYDCDYRLTPYPGDDRLAGGIGQPKYAPSNPCEHLSLEELRRADAEASGDKP